MQVNNKKDTLPNLKIYKPISEIKTDPFKVLSQWVSLPTKTVIFSSEIHDMSPATLWNKIKGRSNVMFVVITDVGDIFGSFHGTVPQKQGDWVWDDNKQFVFTLRNQYHIEPTKFTPKRTTHSLLNISQKNLKKKLFWISDAYRIASDDKSYISSSFDRFYNDPTGIGPSLFTNTVYPETFGVASCYMLQWC
ncbi:TLDc domain-containing protein [Entamoeba marina]